MLFTHFVPTHFVVTLVAAAAKSLQSCPTLCDPRDGSPPGFPIPGILQARTLEWVAISFCNAIVAKKFLFKQTNKQTKHSCLWKYLPSWVVRFLLWNTVFYLASDFCFPEHSCSELADSLSIPGMLAVCFEFKKRRICWGNALLPFSVFHGV